MYSLSAPVLKGIPFFPRFLKKNGIFKRTIFSKITNFNEKSIVFHENYLFLLKKNRIFKENPFFFIEKSCYLKQNPFFFIKKSSVYTKIPFFFFTKKMPLGKVLPSIF